MNEKREKLRNKECMNEKSEKLSKRKKKKIKK